MKGLFRRFFTEKGARNRKVIEGIINRYDAPLKPLKAGWRLSDKVEITQGWGKKLTDAHYYLFTYQCAIQDYHHCISVEVVPEGGGTSIAILLFDAATGAYIKTIWS